MAAKSRLPGGAWYTSRAVSDAPPPPLSVHHLALKVRDLAAAERFFVGVLGLVVQARHDDAHGAPRAFWLRLGHGAFLAVERATEEAPTRADAAPGWHALAFAIGVEDRERWRTRLSAHGHPITKETAYTLYAAGPEGAEIALSHHPVPAPGAEVDAKKTGGVTARLAALVSLSAALLALLAPAGPLAAQRGARRVRTPPDVVIVGSSSVNGALGRLIESELEASGLETERHGRSSTGLARPDFFDWQAEITELGDLARLRGVVVYMGGNDTQAVRLRPEETPGRSRGSESWIIWREEARWTEVYVRRVHEFVEGLCAAGAPRVMWVLPADGDREGWSERIHRVQDAQAAGTRGTSCGIVVDPRGAPLRRGSTSDGVHLTRTGSRDVWRLIGPPLVAGLLSVAATPPPAPMAAGAATDPDAPDAPRESGASTPDEHAEAPGG